MGEVVDVKWSEHPSSMQSLFEVLRVSGDLADMTLTNGTRSLRCHRLVLSAAGSKFHKLLKEYSGEVVVYMDSVDSVVLDALVQFIYRGEANIPQNQLREFMQLAARWQVRGVLDGGCTIVPTMADTAIECQQIAREVTVEANVAMVANSRSSTTTPAPASEGVVKRPPLRASDNSAAPLQIRRPRDAASSSDSSESDTEHRLNLSTLQPTPIGNGSSPKSKKKRRRKLSSKDGVRNSGSVVATVDGVKSAIDSTSVNSTSPGPENVSGGSSTGPWILGQPEAPTIYSCPHCQRLMIRQHAFKKHLVVRHADHTPAYRYRVSYQLKPAETPQPKPKEQQQQEKEEKEKTVQTPTAAANTVPTSHTPRSHQMTEVDAADKYAQTSSDEDDCVGIGGVNVVSPSHLSDNSHFMSDKNQRTAAHHSDLEVVSGGSQLSSTTISVRRFTNVQPYYSDKPGDADSVSADCQQRSQPLFTPLKTEPDLSAPSLDFVKQPPPPLPPLSHGAFPGVPPSSSASFPRGGRQQVEHGAIASDVSRAMSLESDCRKYAADSGYNPTALGTSQTDAPSYSENTSSQAVHQPHSKNTTLHPPFLPKNIASQASYMPPRSTASQGNHVPLPQNNTSQGNYVPPPQNNTSQAIYVPPPQNTTSHGNYVPPLLNTASQASYVPPRDTASQRNYVPPAKNNTSQASYVPLRDTASQRNHVPPPKNTASQASYVPPRDTASQRNYVPPAKNNTSQASYVLPSRNTPSQENFVPLPKNTPSQRNYMPLLPKNSASQAVSTSSQAKSSPVVKDSPQAASSTSVCKVKPVPHGDNLSAKPVGNKILFDEDGCPIEKHSNNSTQQISVRGNDERNMSASIKSPPTTNTPISNSGIALSAMPPTDKTGNYPSPWSVNPGRRSGDAQLDSSAVGCMDRHSSGSVHRWQNVDGVHDGAQQQQQQSSHYWSQQQENRSAPFSGGHRPAPFRGGHTPAPFRGGHQAPVPFRGGCEFGGDVDMRRSAEQQNQQQQRHPPSPQSRGGLDRGKFGDRRQNPVGSSSRREGKAEQQNTSDQQSCSQKKKKKKKRKRGHDPSTRGDTSSRRGQRGRGR